MKILENDIASIEPFGMLDGKPVNLVRTKGGLNLATMMDAKGQDSVLGAASHQAILCYTVEQRFPTFQPMIMKSEGLKLNAESHSHFLSDDLRKSGHDIYSVQNGNHIEFYVTKQNIKVGYDNGKIEGDTLILTPPVFPHATDMGLWNGLSKAVSEKALTSGLKRVRIK
jgi:hypothetical protein